MCVIILRYENDIYVKSGYLRENCFKLERFVSERFVIIIIYMSRLVTVKNEIVFQQKIFRYHICKQ